MTTLALPIGPTELIIILVIILVLFGGARLAGLGKSTGRAIREFKEETKGLGEDKKADDEAVDAEVVDEQTTTEEPPAVSGPKDSGADSTQSGTSQSAQPSETRRDS